MGFAFLDRYDVDACAAECNKRGGDGWGGACQYFNIWRAVVNGNPTTYSCSMVSPCLIERVTIILIHTSTIFRPTTPPPPTMAKATFK